MGNSSSIACSASTSVRLVQKWSMTHEDTMGRERLRTRAQATGLQERFSVPFRRPGQRATPEDSDPATWQPRLRQIR